MSRSSSSSAAGEGAHGVAGYEPEDVRPRNVVYVTALLFLGIAVSAIIVAGLLTLLLAEDEGPRPTRIEAQQQVPPAPRLQVTPAVDGLAIRAIAESRLRGYAWSDKAAGTVHVPIERAMELLAESGWPTPTAALSRTTSETRETRP